LALIWYISKPNDGKEPLAGPKSKGCWRASRQASKERRLYNDRQVFGRCTKVCGYNDPKVVLIDGRQLAELMIDQGLGTTTTASYHIRRIDSDYFAEE
jgi:hypothetical protein